MGKACYNSKQNTANSTHSKQIYQQNLRCFFQILFEAGNQLNGGMLSQSASSNHALLSTKSAFMIKKKRPLSQLISIQ